MMNSKSGLALLSSSELLARTHKLVEHSRNSEAELLLHLGEIDERRLYLERAFRSMFAFCIGELRFSEAAAYDRIMVARAGRQLPTVIEALRSGQVHLTGLRLLVPHLTPATDRELLAQAAGKSKREIEELVARLAPQPPVPTVVRKLPDRANLSPESPAFSFDTAIGVAPSESSPALVFAPPSAPAPRHDERRPVIAPLAEDIFKFQFTVSRACRDKFRQAQDLLRHRIPDGDLGTIVEKALDLLIEKVKKERFAAGRKARQAATEDGDASCSRHIPDAIKREVFERDAGRCLMIDHISARAALRARLSLASAALGTRARGLAIQEVHCCEGAPPSRRWQR